MEDRIFEDPSDVSDFMPCKLKWEDWIVNKWIFWSNSRDDELKYQQRKFTAVAPISRHSNIAPAAIDVRLIISDLWISGDAHCLAQFWVPVNGNGSKFLSIADHYFVLINGFDGRLCEYRKICLNTLIPVDTNNAGFDEGLLGPVERAFISGLVEVSPDLQSDSAGESPLLQHAIRLGIRQHWVYPWIDGETLKGVVEFALVGSTSSDSTPPSWLVEGWHENELAELESMLDTVCVGLRVPCAQIWIPVSQSKALFRTDRRYFSTNYDVDGNYAFADASEISYIEKGKVLVGKAFLSQGSCFCKDVTQLSLADYPQLPFVQKRGLRQCFAICLRSSIRNCDFLFVVEYFLPPKKDAVTFLNMLLSTMKEEFKEVSLASGEELGRRILVEVVKVSPRDELDSFEIGQPLPSVQPFQGGRETAETDSWPDLSNFQNSEDVVAAAQHIPSRSMQPNVEIDPTDNERSNYRVEHNDITRCLPADEAEATDRDSHFINGATADSQKKNENLRRIKNDHGITREKLEENYGKSRKEAAQVLNVSVATLKRTCREYGITRWPHHKTRKVTPRVSRTVSLQGVTPYVRDQECRNLSQENGGTSYDAHKRSSAKGKACDSVMFAKVTYERFIIKFKLSASSTKKELEGQVEKVFNISPQRFSIEYQDGDDDWILIPCDSHLRDGMDELRSLGKSTMKFRVTLKSDHSGRI